jgi:hypothetical protein
LDSRADLTGPSRLPRPVLHARDAEVTIPDSRLQLVLGEAPSVIADLESEQGGAKLQVNLDSAGVGVLHRVG